MNSSRRIVSSAWMQDCSKETTALHITHSYLLCRSKWRQGLLTCRSSTRDQTGDETITANLLPLRWRKSTKICLKNGSSSIKSQDRPCTLHTVKLESIEHLLRSESHQKWLHLKSTWCHLSTPMTQRRQESSLKLPGILLDPAEIELWAGTVLRRWHFLDATLVQAGHWTHSIPLITESAHNKT